MARKGYRKPKAAIGDPTDPDGFSVWLHRFLESLRVRNYSAATVVTREQQLRLFFVWCDARGVVGPREVTKPILERYQRHVYHLRQSSGRNRGKPLGFQAQMNRLVPLRVFFRWLTRENVLLWNPASELMLPKVRRQLPKYVLTAEEAETVLAVPDVSEPLGVRDRAMLEVLYSTGIRRMELLNLTIYDICEDRGTLMVRRGKGGKDRVVPISERAMQWVRRYLNEVRDGLLVPPASEQLFLSHHGESPVPRYLTALVRGYVKESGVPKRGSCHLFRHTAATLMLENGADIRSIQELLGHASLEATQIYTHVSIARLKAVHEATHPASRDLLRPVAKAQVTETAGTESELQEALADELAVELGGA